MTNTETVATPSAWAMNLAEVAIAEKRSCPNLDSVGWESYGSPGECARHRVAAALDAAGVRELTESAAPFVGRWGRWIKARANHATTETGGRPNERDYLTVQKHIDRLASALALH